MYCSLLATFLIIMGVLKFWGKGRIVAMVSFSCIIDFFLLSRARSLVSSYWSKTYLETSGSLECFLDMDGQFCTYNWSNDCKASSIFLSTFLIMKVIVNNRSHIHQISIRRLFTKEILWFPSMKRDGTSSNALFPTSKADS